jgi:predicted nucleic acid-binding protein
VAELFTVDASVFINAFNPREAGHEDSFRFLRRLQQDLTQIVVPTLLLPEVAGAVARGRDDATLAKEFASAVAAIPHLVLIPLTPDLATEAARVAADYRLRGSDAVYASIALQFASTLVTLDREQRERVASVVPATSPSEALEARG